MSTSPYLILTTGAAMSSAAVGGLFYAFSTFVTRGLDRAEPLDAIAAVRGINAEAQANASFLLLFAGSALLALGAGIAVLFRMSQPGSGYVLAGAVLGVVAFIVTVAFNVPLNDQLESVNPTAADASGEWRAYAVPWTAWNHLRTVAPLLGSVLILTGLHRR